MHLVTECRNEFIIKKSLHCVDMNKLKFISQEKLHNFQNDRLLYNAKIIV